MNEHDRDGVRQRIFRRGHRHRTRTPVAAIIAVADVGGRGKGLVVSLAGGGEVGVGREAAASAVPSRQAAQLALRLINLIYNRQVQSWAFCRGISPGGRGRAT